MNIKEYIANKKSIINNLFSNKGKDESITDIFYIEITKIENELLDFLKKGDISEKDYSNYVASLSKLLEQKKIKHIGLLNKGQKSNNMNKNKINRTKFDSKTSKKRPTILKK